MTPTPSTRSRRGTSFYATIVAAAAAVALTTGYAAPLGASAIPSGPGLIICPPQITKVGTPVDVEVADSESSSGFDTTIDSGSLPDGLALIPVTGLADRIKGTPTKVSSFRFNLHFSNNVGGTGDKTCVMDIVPVSSIVDRIFGDDRYDTAANLAMRVASAKAPIVYVASGENYPDALSAAAIAAQHNAPLVLATSTELPNYAYNVVTSLAPTNIVVVGGETALSPSVVHELEAMRIHPTVTRIGGADRFEVSRNLIAHPTFGALPSTAISVATGLKFPDALSATPPAAKNTMPVLLVNGAATALTAPERALLTARAVTSATIFGGEDTVSAALAADIMTTTGSVTRIEGADRFVTSANVTAANYASPLDTVYFATGENYPDALAGGVLAGVTKSPILLVHKSCVATEVAAQVRALKPRHIVLLGGPDVLDAKLENLPLCS